MTKFVGAEYLIASLLIEKGKEGNKFITLEELSKCGVFMQRESVKEKVDAVFLVTKYQLCNAIYDFTDYFEYKLDNNGQIVGITIEKTKDINDLEYRFMGYLPLEILEFLSTTIKKYVA